ncbi:hypothetical protein AVEN_223929-1 [Araneus ventricosus]|uniref:Uncharacterized protein n=1 Tax=Araneus ventricosus TaxID=182803 RepID=A0A4Y2TEQ0_ARAVE|nr:hypothetical protein AVEN_223929-1 [Araneus ventricosus]
MKFWPDADRSFLGTGNSKEYHKQVMASVPSGWKRKNAPQYRSSQCCDAAWPQNGTFTFSETAFRSMDEKPEMFKSRRIDCISYTRTWNSFEFGKCCDKLEEQALVLMVDNGLSTLQYQRILEHAENLNCKLYPSHHKFKEAKQLCCPHSISMINISRNNFADTR